MRKVLFILHQKTSLPGDIGNKFIDRDYDIEIRVPQSSFSPANHYELKYSISKNESKKFYYLSENKEIPKKIKINYDINKIAISDNKITKQKSRILYFYYLEKN